MGKSISGYSYPHEFSLDDANKVLNGKLPSELFEYDIKHILQNRFAFGHTKSSTHPKAKSSYLMDIKQSSVAIINPKKTKDALDLVISFLCASCVLDKSVIFVTNESKLGSRSDIFVNAAKSCGCGYITKWKSGVLTNWTSTLRAMKRIERYEKETELSLERSDESSEDSSFIEQLKNKKIEKDKKRDYNNLKTSFGGIVGSKRLPDIIVVDNISFNKQTLKEAKSLGIPVISLTDSNIDPSTVDFPVPGNDDSDHSLRFFAGLISAAISLSKNKDSVKNFTDSDASPKSVELEN
jgi:small subunit ribosomal protein S2